ncbi:alanine dehydrogenase [Candidatus Thiomargarita nelsonii]|uniref:Alanine dehydrogenase n=1 Tax=Candidatus Thiomargarita nelsonii TaxID=1003181 RepID=A0A176RU37_9GAMM|nr:alanine dehydrogenase [Candidatus Thiomargarita nelsonii]
MATQIGSHLLHQPQGGKGILLGGVTASARGKLVVLGAGAAGSQATRVATALGANVIVFDKRWDRLFQPGIRYEKIMSAFGGHAEFVEYPEQLIPALKRGLASGLPACINVRVDPFTPYPQQ